jgi:hypothetical protein
MGIYIKGMEMPTRCENCGFVNAYRHPPTCGLTGTRILGNANARPNNCPLVEVPPHGRLIDADALIDAIIAKYIRHEQHRELVFAVVQIKQDMADIINELPTILEAEEGE